MREIFKKKTFRFRHHFKRLKFDYPSSNTVSNQQIKLRTIFVVEIGPKLQCLLKVKEDLSKVF